MKALMKKLRSRRANYITWTAEELYIDPAICRIAVWQMIGGLPGKSKQSGY